MDAQETRAWLDERFKNHDEDKVYFAHEPIYGFRKGHSEPALVFRYIVAYQIAKALSNLKFSSLLDVGGAEAYKAFIAREIFGAEVRSCDLSKEACKRAREIFKIDADAVDVHNLPYKDNQFSVVLCSETLEHVTDFHKAIYELLRVAGQVVLITVPHEPKEVVEGNIRKKTPHGHIHNFDISSFCFLEAEGYHVFSKRMVSPLLAIPNYLIDANPLSCPAIVHSVYLPKILAEIYNSLLPILRKLLGKRMAASLLRMDEFVCKFTPFHHSILIVILKNEQRVQRRKTRIISPYHILDMEVPYHYIRR